MCSNSSSSRRHPTSGPTAFCVVLAAGQARRFGRDKLHARLHGKAILAHVLEVVARLLERGTLAGGVIVHRAGDTRAQELGRAAGLVPISNCTPEKGLSVSLRLGLEELGGRRPAPTWALVVLGDQPLLREAVIDALVAAIEEGEMDLIRPVYDGDPRAPGHPVLLHHRVWSRAAELRDDQGFRALSSLAQLRVATIPVRGDNPDVDVPADLERLEVR